MSNILDRLKNTVTSTTEAQDSLILKDILNNNPEFIISKLRRNSYILANEEFVIPNYKALIVTSKYNNSGEKIIFSAGDERVLITVNSLDILDKTTMDFDLFLNGLLLSSEDYTEENSRNGRNFYIKKSKFSINENVLNVIIKDRLNIEPKYKFIPVSEAQFDDIVLTYPKYDFGNFIDNVDYLILFKYTNGKFYKLERNIDYFLSLVGTDVKVTIKYTLIQEETLFVLQNSLYYYEKESFKENLLIDSNHIPLTFGVKHPIYTNEFLVLPLPIDSALGIEVYVNGYKLIPEYDYTLDNSDGLKLQFSNIIKEKSKVRINTVPHHDLNFSNTLLDTIKKYDGQTLVNVRDIMSNFKQSIDLDLQIVPITDLPVDLAYFEFNLARTLVNKRNIKNIDNIAFALYGCNFSEQLVVRNTLLFNANTLADIQRFKNSDLYLNSLFEVKDTETSSQYTTRIAPYKNTLKSKIIGYKENTQGNSNILEYFKHSTVSITGINLILNKNIFLKYEDVNSQYRVKLSFSFGGIIDTIDVTGFAKVSNLSSSKISSNNNVEAKFVTVDYIEYSNSKVYSIERSRLIDIDIVCENPIIIYNLEMPRVKVLGYYEDFSVRDLTTEPAVTIVYPTLNKNEYGPIIATYSLNGLTLEDYYYIYSKDITEYNLLSLTGDIPCFFIDNVTQGRPVLRPFLKSSSANHYINNMTLNIDNTIEPDTMNQYQDFQISFIFNDVDETGKDIRIDSIVNSYIAKYGISNVELSTREDILIVHNELFNPIFDTSKAKFIDVLTKDNFSVIFGKKDISNRRFLVPNAKRYLGTHVLVVIYDSQNRIIKSYPTRIGD